MNRELVYPGVPVGAEDRGDQSRLNIMEYPERGVGHNWPSLAVDSLLQHDRVADRVGADGRQRRHRQPSGLIGGVGLRRGRRAGAPREGSGRDRAPTGACTRMFPIHGTSRTVAGGPCEGDVYACALQPVDRAIARGVYDDWRPDAVGRARLRQIFPSGVCDYTKGDAGRPGR
jgi:hypothetical protein